MFGKRKGLSVLVALAMLAVTVLSVNAQDMTPSVTVNDQPIEEGMVTVATVVSDGPGWIVIHADEEGAPGPVIGQAAVEDGENTDVMVEIDTEAATETLYAMLHEDSGEMGTYEFPEGDPPVQVEGEVVVQSFTIGGGEVLPETGVEHSVALLWASLAVALVGLLMMGLGLRRALVTTR